MENGNKLYCDNPQCGGQITEGPVMYDKERKKVTHPGMCQELYGGHLALKTREITQFQFKELSLDEAMALRRDGKLAQSQKDLETKVE